MSWDSIATYLELAAVRAGLQIVGVVIAAFVLTRLLRRLTTQVGQKVSKETTPVRALQRTETLTRVLSSAGIVVIWSLGLFFILGAVRVNLAPLLAGVGIIGLAVGFGAQNLVRDVVTGFFVLLEDQYGVGDIVEINGVATGKVEQLTLRMTGLRALDGTMHFVANGEITHIANRSKDWARAVVDVGVAYKEDPVRVRAVLEEVAEDVQQDEELSRLIYARPQVLGVEMLGEYEVMWRMTCDTKPGRQWEVGRQLRESVKVSFDRHDVEIPFPHRVMIQADSNGSGAASD